VLLKVVVPVPAVWLRELTATVPENVTLLALVIVKTLSIVAPTFPENETVAAAESAFKVKLSVPAPVPVTVVKLIVPPLVDNEVVVPPESVTPELKVRVAARPVFLIVVLARDEVEVTPKLFPLRFRVPAVWVNTDPTEVAPDSLTAGFKPELLLIVRF